MPDTEIEWRIVNRKALTAEISEFPAKPIDLNEVEVLVRGAILPVAGRRVDTRSKHPELTAKDALFVFLDRPRTGETQLAFSKITV